jgi:hypothetical protein
VPLKTQTTHTDRPHSTETRVGMRTHSGQHTLCTRQHDGTIRSSTVRTGVQKCMHTSEAATLQCNNDNSHGHALTHFRQTSGLGACREASLKRFQCRTGGCQASAIGHAWWVEVRPLPGNGNDGGLSKQHEADGQGCACPWPSAFAVWTSRGCHHLQGGACHFSVQICVARRMIERETETETWLRKM